MSRKVKRVMIVAPFAILGIALFIFLGGAVVMRLWNWLLPPLFGWHMLTFWQALGLLVLCRILFGGLGRHGSMRSNMRRHMEQRMESRSANMTPEEREQYRQRMRECWGFAPSPGVPDSSGSSSDESKE